MNSSVHFASTVCSTNFVSTNSCTMRALSFVFWIAQRDAGRIRECSWNHDIFGRLLWKPRLVLLSGVLRLLPPEQLFSAPLERHKISPFWHSSNYLSTNCAIELCDTYIQYIVWITICEHSLALYITWIFIDICTVLSQFDKIAQIFSFLHQSNKTLVE